MRKPNKRESDSGTGGMESWSRHQDKIDYVRIFSVFRMPRIGINEAFFALGLKLRTMRRFYEW